MPGSGWTAARWPLRNTWFRYEVVQVVMNPENRITPIPLILATLLVSTSCSMLEYGIYWFTNASLHFSKTENLTLALVFGSTYVVSAWGSHWASRTMGEKPLMLACLAVQVLLAGCVVWSPTKGMMFLTFAGMSVSYGILWPLIESRFATGRTVREATRAIGRFNISWALTSVIGTAICGALLKLGTAGFFAVASLVNLVGLAVIALGFPRCVAPLREDHPERPGERVLTQARRLLAAARIGMVAAYTAIFILAPLLPDVLKNPAFGLSPVVATVLASLVFGARCITFVVLERWHGWHLRAWPLVFSAFALPVGVALALFGTTLPLFVFGEVILGIAMGFIYVGSIDYGMIVKNASVEGGGDHEAVVGLGFTLGPLLGLLGARLGAVPFLGERGGMALGLIPAALLALAILWPLRRRP